MKLQENEIILTEERMKDFQKLYAQKFNEEISEQEAHNKARNLINLFLVVLGKQINFEINNKNNI